ncbi:transcriptional regulator, partial [Pseudomonas protegens]|nr:transcriptional regulator [Pseudomonas protegens]
MNVPTDIQIIHGPDGSPAFVVIPYAQYMAQY